MRPWALRLVTKSLLGRKMGAFTAVRRSRHRSLEAEVSMAASTAPALFLRLRARNCTSDLSASCRATRLKEPTLCFRRRKVADLS